MKEFIEREAAIEDLRSDFSYHSYAGESAAKIINAIPAADVREVVKGKWTRMNVTDVFGDVHCKCSVCEEDQWQGPGWFSRANFCPNCGADLRKAGA